MWMNNCIGAQNQKHFLLFLSYTSCHTAGALPMSLWCLFALKKEENESLKMLTLYDVVSVGSVLVMLLSACLGRYCLQLLAEQWRSLKKNQTFIEQLQGHLRFSFIYLKIIIFVCFKNQTLRSLLKLALH